jgi:hypothetical protein
MKFGAKVAKFYENNVTYNVTIMRIYEILVKRAKIAKVLT